MFDYPIFIIIAIFVLINLVGLFPIIRAKRYARLQNKFNKQGYNFRDFNREGRHISGKNHNENRCDFRGFNIDTKLFLNRRKYDYDGFDFEAYDRFGYNRQGFKRDGYNHLGFDAKGFNKNGYDIQGYAPDGFNKLNYDKEGYNREGFNIKGYNRLGFDQHGYNARGYDTSGYNKFGFDVRGFDRQGYNKKGLDKDGYNSQGYNEKGFDKNGFNKDGFNERGFDVKGFNAQGYDKNGYGRDGFNQAGYDQQGFNKAGYNSLGFNAKGFNAEGYDKEGFNKEGLNKGGYNRQGFNKAGYNALGFDANGFNLQGYNKDGFDRKGFNASGYDIHGFDTLGYGKDGRNKENKYWWLCTDDRIKKNKDIFEKYYNLDYKVKLAKHSNNPFINNAYNVLGLHPLASSKEVNRRVNELKKMASIGMTNSYENEIFGKMINRDEKSITEASQNISDPKKKLYQQFLWLDLSDPLISKIIRENKIETAIFHLYYEYRFNNNIIALKSALIYTLIYVSLFGNDEVITQTISDWNIVFKNQKYWNWFKGNFHASNEWEVEESVFDMFKSGVKELLVESYYLLSELVNKPEMNVISYKNFQVYSKKFYEKTVSPLLIELNAKIAEISKIETKVNSNKSIAVNYRKALDQLYTLATNHHQQISQYGLIELIDCKEAFNNIADIFRDASIDVLNNIDRDNSQDNNYGKKLLTFAKQFARSEVLKARIESDFAAIEKGEVTTRLMEQITSDIQNKNYSDARNKIERLKQHDSSRHVQEMCRQFYIISYKNESHESIRRNVDLFKARSFLGWSYVSDYATEILLAIDVLIAIAEAEDDYAEKRELESLKSNFSNQFIQYRRGY